MAHLQLRAGGTPHRQIILMVGGNLFEVTTQDTGQVGINPPWFIWATLKL